MTDEHVLTVPEAADRLRVSEETVRRWIRKGQLKALSLGSTRAGYRIARADLEAFVQLHYGMTLGGEKAAA